MITRRRAAMATNAALSCGLAVVLTVLCSACVHHGPAIERDSAIALVENKSVTTRCAEEDNVYYTVASPDVRAFDVSMHKAHYLDDLKMDATAPIGPCRVTTAAHRTSPFPDFAARACAQTPERGIAVRRLNARHGPPML